MNWHEACADAHTRADKTGCDHLICSVKGWANEYAVMLRPFFDSIPKHLRKKCLVPPRAR